MADQNMDRDQGEMEKDNETMDPDKKKKATHSNTGDEMDTESDMDDDM